MMRRILDRLAGRLSPVSILWLREHERLEANTRHAETIAWSWDAWIKARKELDAQVKGRRAPDGSAR